MTMDNFSKIFLASKYPMQRVFLFLTLIFFLMSCAPIHISRTEEDSQAIADLEKQIPEEKDESLRARYHLQLAWLYSYYKNPKKDYRKSLEEFELYLSLVPNEKRSDEIQNWLSLLQALERSERERLKSSEGLESIARENLKTRSALGDHAKKNKQLQEENASLKEDNASLKRAIENLKNLNLQVEKKRKSVKED